MHKSRRRLSPERDPDKIRIQTLPQLLSDQIKESRILREESQSEPRDLKYFAACEANNSADGNIVRDVVVGVPGVVSPSLFDITRVFPGIAPSVQLAEPLMLIRNSSVLTR